MAASGPTIIAKFLADTSKLTGEVDKAAGGAESRLGSFAKKASLAIGGAFAAKEIIDFGREAIGAASDLSESASKVGVVFGQQAGAVMDWSKNSATAIGLSQQAALEAAGTYGNLAVALGLPTETAATMSTTLTGLAGDLASFNNVPVGDAIEALRSGLTGETEPLKKFGINLNDAALKAEAMNLGLSDGKGVLSASAKAQAAYALIMKQSTTAQGDFARTSGGLANQQRIAAAEMENLKATIGQALLPVMVTIAHFLSGTLLPAFAAVFDWIDGHKEVVVAALIGVAVVVGSVVIPAFIAWAVAAGAAAIATIAAAAPFIAIGAVIAGVAYLIINNWDTIVAATTKAWDTIVGAVRFVWEWIRDNWPLLLAIITGPIGAAVLLVVKNWDTIHDAVMTVYNWVRDNWPLLLAIITGPIGAAVLLIAANWQSIKDGAQAVLDFITDIFGRIGGAISSVVGGITDAIAKVVDAIKAPINAIIRAFNAIEFRIPSFTLPSFDVGPVHIGGETIGGTTIGFPDIPQLAAGAVLTAPTLFVGGEAGTEIVAPESLLRAIVAEEGGGHYTLNIYPRTADAADVAYGFRRLELMAGVL